jgi:XXXCH domain-containing protein
MSEKPEKRCTRLELADRFEIMARELRSGKLELEGYSGEIPESVELKFHVKEKRGELRCKIELRWSSLGAYAQAERHAIDEWQSSFKQVKKQLAVTFKQPKKGVQEPLAPGDASLKAFAAASQAFAATAATEWPEGTQEYMGHLENLLRAVEQREHEAVLHELQDLERCMVTCHREHR